MNDIERYNFWHCEMDAFLIQHQKDIDEKINNKIEDSHDNEIEDSHKKEGAV